jgi:hypothetical protein
MNIDNRSSHGLPVCNQVHGPPVMPGASHIHNAAPPHISHQHKGTDMPCLLPHSLYTHNVANNIPYGHNTMPGPPLPLPTHNAGHQPTPDIPSDQWGVKPDEFDALLDEEELPDEAWEVMCAIEAVGQRNGDKTK